jgi:1-acyl-sn-glycerol-3-phosphate acyltransferase
MPGILPDQAPAILRTILIVVPAMVLAALVVPLVMIPVTWVLRDIRPMYGLSRHVVRMLFGLAGVRIEARGFDPFASPRPSVFVANHVSNLDPPLAFTVLPRVAIMGKEVVFRWPVFGYALKMAAFIPVDRKRPDSRRRALEAGIARLRAGLSLLIFPEGTRSRDGLLLPFRPGPFTMAIEAQAPVVPFTILGTRDVMPKGRFAIRPGLVVLLFHDPIPTAGLSQEDRETVMWQARAAIESGLPPELHGNAAAPGYSRKSRLG